MKNTYLFPHKYKKIGWMLLLPSAVFGFVILVMDYNPDSFDFRVPAIFIDEFFGEDKLFGMVENNILNEIVGVITIVGSLMVAFSKERMEDEYISKLRLESLVWAVFCNYAILLFSMLFIYDLSFLWIMIFNMFTVLFFFIIRFNWKIAKLKRIASHEE